jgi:hypothetical protein
MISESAIEAPRVRSMGLSKGEIEALRQDRLERRPIADPPILWITCVDGLGAPARGSLQDPSDDKAARGRCREDIAA